MNCIPKLRTVWTLLTVIVLLLGGTLAATGSPPLAATPTPRPVGKQPADIDALSTDLHAPPPLEPGSRGPYIYLTNYTFDPLLETTPQSLPRALTLSSYSPGEPGYYLVQFHGPIQPAWKEAIVAAGAQLFDYIPDFAFVVKMDDTASAAVVAMDTVRWVGLYQPGYRIAPSLMSPSASAEGVEPTDVTLVVFKGEDMTAITGRLQELGGKILDVAETRWKGKIRVQIPHSQINAVAHLSGVKWIEPSPEWQLFNNEAADIMGVREVWDTHGLYGAGQIAAVCDTGLDQGSASTGSLHDDFEDGSGSSRVVAIYDLVGGGDGADDVNSGHGSHVAGSVLGNGDRSGSTPSTHSYPSTAYVGMAPEASLVFQAVEDNTTGSLTGIPADLNDLFVQAYNDGARIHTNSWGADSGGAYTSDSESVDEFMWDHPEFTILFAAANAGVDGDADGVVDLFSMASPGTAKNCITVGASENDRLSGGYNPGGACGTWGGSSDGCWPSDFPANPIMDDRLSDDPDGMAAFSSRGPGLDGRFKPDVVAPGTNIASTKSSATSSTGWGAIDSYYTYMGGTSMATPLVAGATTLVREYYTDLEGITPSAALIKATLINGATDIYPGQYGVGTTQEITPTRPNNVEGWGRVNIEQTLFPSSPRERVYYDETSGLSTGATTTYFITITDASEPLNVTLAWSDYPGSPAANGGLVNDLDLSITDPNATVHYPNHANPGTGSQYLFYDDGDPYGVYRWDPGNRVGVRFTPNAYPATLQKGQFLLASKLGIYPKAFNYYVYDGDTSGPDSILTSGSTALQQAGWREIDLSGSGVTINSGDFFLVIELPDDDLEWGFDDTDPIDNRSWDYDGSWSSWTVNDYMFRAVVSDPSFTPTDFDRVNNVVGIDIDTPVLGTYTATVSGYNVPQGPQPYALVASGAISSAVSTAPMVLGITPNTGVNTGTVHIANLAGLKFQSGASVKLTKSGEPAINASNVNVVPTTTITCDFDLTGAATGQWNVVVTNPDSQSGTLANGFTVYAPGATPTVSSITPNEGTNTGPVHITNLAGSNFQSGATVELTRTGESAINATNVSVASPSQITCDFDLTGATPGQWNVSVTNPGNQSGQLTNGFTVKGTVFLPLVLKNWPPLPDGLYATADTTVLQGYPSSSFGSVTDMWVGYDHCVGAKIGRSLVRFDVSDIPAATQISQAKLYLYLANSCDIGERTHRVTTYRITSNWSSSSVTWNSQPGRAEAYGSRLIPSRTYGWYTFDVTALVQGWVNGSLANYGLMLRGPEGSGDDSARLGFYTLNRGSTYAPRISLTYPGAMASEQKDPSAEGISDSARCGPTVQDVLGISLDALGEEMFEAAEELTCTAE